MLCSVLLQGTEGGTYLFVTLINLLTFLSCCPAFSFARRRGRALCNRPCLKIRLELKFAAVFCGR